MADTTTSRHESNYIKIAMVVLRVSPRAVRVQFDKECHPNCLQRTLRSKLGCLSDLKAKKRITQPQWNLLFPRTGTGEQPSSKDFDITLMICLLRNLIPIDVMDKLPSAKDTSLRADLSRIKFYRNIIVHCDSALVDDTEFESYWKDVTPAILRLGGNSLKEECDDWYGRNLDAEQRDNGLKCIKDEKRLALVEEELVEQSKELAEQSKELAEQSKELAEQSKELAEQSKELVETNKKLMELEQEQSNPVPKKIRESFTEEIESWKIDKFFETSAVATILEEVRNKSFIVITGPSGIGKSTIVKFVALQLQKTKDYHILPVMCPKDIVKYFDPNIKQIYIIDDICGKFFVDQSMINSWERVERKILKYRKINKEFRVLGTCRLEISISSPFRKLHEKHEITECNLLQKKFLYSKEEKLKIAACHIDQETIKQLNDKILNTYDMFPLLCMMYAASGSNPGVRFFEYPLQAMEEQLDEMKEQNECCFIGLALIVVYNNKLHKLLLQNRNDHKFEVVFNDVFEDLGLVNRPSKHSVLSGLQTLEGIYTEELKSAITVIHDKIFDIFALYFGKRIPKTILAHGSGTFIAERFLFESVEEDCDGLKIVIPSEVEHSYFNRMVEEIENNRFHNVFENVQVCNELYQGKFISFLSKHAHQSIIQKLLYNKWPLYLSAVNGCKFLVQFILNEKRTSGMCNKLDKDGNHQDMLKDKPESDMYACNIDTDNDECTTGFYDTVDDKCNPEKHAYRIQFENSPMVAACEGGYIDIVECLVENGYNIDHSDNNLPTPLLSACNYNNKDVVDFLLKRNCKVDEINEKGMTALHAACGNGNIDIVTSLLNCNSNMNLCDFRGFTPLYYACVNGHTDVVQILLDNNCDILIHGNTINEVYATPIQCACANGYTDIVKLLLDNNCDVFDDAIDNGFSSALYFACKGCFVDIVDLLLRNNCNINQCKPWENKSLLINACNSNKEAIVKLLLSYEACDVNIIDCYNRSALHYACREGRADVAKLLLSYEACDVNIIDCDNRNALHYACRYSQTDVVELLLKRHCNVNLNDEDMKTPLFSACEFGQVDIVKMLINQDNCMIDVLDVEGNSLLHATCGKSCRVKYYTTSNMWYPTINARIEIIGILLGKSCVLNVLNNEGQSVLHVVCKNGDTEIVDFLLRSNSNVNQCDKEKKTPLFIACEEGYIDIVRLLIESKCEIFNHSLNGQTVLHAVCSRLERIWNINERYELVKESRKDILTLLIDKKCDVNISDNKSHTPLHIACYKGNVALVEILLRNKCVVDKCDNLNRTPFFLACEAGHKDVVKSLMNNDCKMDIKDTIGRSALHAVYTKRSSFLGYEGDRVDIAELLINKRCGVYDLDDAGHSVLHAACEYGHTKIVDILLRSNSNVNQCDKAKKTPLFIACENGDIDIVRLLIESKCEIFNHSLNGQTVLHAVCSGRDRRNMIYSGLGKFTEGHKDILTLLIDKKCDVNILDNNSQTPLHIACYQGNVALVEILLRNKCVIDKCDNLNKTPFVLACEEGHKDVVKSLMKNNCNMDITDKIGRSALQAVCTTHSVYGYNEGHRDVAELLINKKCGVYDLDDAGQSALHGACKQGDPGIVKLLLENRFDVDQRDKMGETPIFNACRIYCSDALKLLIEWKCDVNVLNINGLNALNIAFNSECFRSVSCIHGLETQFKEVVKLLVGSGCSVNICDADGQTPLHRACSEGYVDEAELFLKRNSNINQCDKLMKTPLILAVKGRHTKVVSMLVENKCDIGIRDKDGRTALDIAVKKKVVDIKNILLNMMKKDTNAHDGCTSTKKAKYF